MRGLNYTGLLAPAFYLIIGSRHLFKMSRRAMLIERYGVWGVPWADLLGGLLALLLVIPTLSPSRLHLWLSVARPELRAETMVILRALWIVAAVPVLSCCRLIITNVIVKTSEPIDAVDAPN